MASAFVVGGASYDSIVYLDAFPQRTETHVAEDFRETVGSTGSGKAMNLGRLGFDTTLHAMIGDDWYGEQLQQAFDAEPLSFLYDFDPNGTERHVNLMNDAGERISIFVVTSTPDPDIDYSRLESRLESCDYAVINVVNYARHLLPAAERFDKPVWVDVHAYDGRDPFFDDYLDHADYLFFSTEGMDDYREFMTRQIDAGTELVVGTRGRDGAVAVTSEYEWIEVPAIDDYDLADANGAGDAFFAGYLYGFDRGYDVRRCMRTGTIAAGECITAGELAHPDLSPERIADRYDEYYE
jgi:sugar/nucleoside kinase (ribokinase family)